MKFFYLILAFVLSSCYVNMGTDISVNYKFARRAAIHAWTEVYGSVSPVCIWQAKRVEEHERSQKRLNEICNFKKGGEGRDVGCVRTHDQFSAQFVDTQMYILRDDFLPEEKLLSAVHEYIHVIGNCQSFDSDPNHKRKKWWENNWGEKSIEVIGFEKVLDLYFKSGGEPSIFNDFEGAEPDAGSLNDTI